MQEIFAQYWWLFLAVFLIGLAVAWWVLVASRRTRVEIDKRDVLDEGADPSQRNQALIDAPSATASATAAASTPAQPARASSASSAIDKSSGDDLTKIKGIGPKLVVLLNDLGVTRYSQIASWDNSEIDRIDAQLGRFEGRIRRDNWVEQAKLLAAGEDAQFQDKFGATKT